MVKPKKLDEIAYQYIKGKIYTRQWLPQTRITELDLSKELHISRTPIRQAFQQLQKEGYLDLEAYKGARVREQTIGSRGLQERMEFIEMNFIDYFYYLQIKEIVFDGTEVDKLLVHMKNCHHESERAFLDLETQLLHEILAFSKNNYSVKIVMDTIRELQKIDNPEYLTLMKRNREMKIEHFERLNGYLKSGNYPLARKEMRILINKITISIIHYLSE